MNSFNNPQFLLRHFEYPDFFQSAGNREAIPVTQFMLSVAEVQSKGTIPSPSLRVSRFFPIGMYREAIPVTQFMLSVAEVQSKGTIPSPSLPLSRFFNQHIARKHKKIPLGI